MTPWTFGTIALVTAAIAGALFWIRYDFGPTWAVAALVIVVVVLVGSLEWFKTLATTRAANNALVDAMEKIESGNIAQFGAIKEFIKVEGAKAKKDNEEEWRVLRQQPAIEAQDVWISPQRQISQQSTDDVAWN